MASLQPDVVILPRRAYSAADYIRAAEICRKNAALSSGLDKFLWLLTEVEASVRAKAKAGPTVTRPAGERPLLLDRDHNHGCDGGPA